MFENLRNVTATGPVLITGHTGFKGSWLTMLLDQLGIENFGISLPPESNSHAILLGMDTRASQDYLDIRDLESLSSKIQEISPSVIIHMAAQPIVSKAFEHVGKTFYTNVQGTVNVIESSRIAKSVKSFAVITTDKVYSNNALHNTSHVEDDPLGADEPYGLSKVGTELVVDAYNSTEPDINKKLYTLRSGNVIGGGDLALNRLLPDLGRHIFDGRELQVRNPNASRPWQHVLDTLYGYLLGIEHNLSGEFERAFNFSPAEESLTVQQVINIAKKSFNVGFNSSNASTSSSVHEDTLLNLNSHKSREILGWKNYFTQAEAVEDTLLWWKAYSEGESVEGLARESIENYLESSKAK
jgi:CDP-glucose 4,6-dehydratase